MKNNGITLRFTNTAILALMAVLTLTGLYGLVWTLNGWIFDIHRAAGWALIALIPWKAAISFGSLKRGLAPRFDRSLGIIVSVVLAAAALLVLSLGLMWALRLGPSEIWLRRTVISWHWLLALALLPPFVLHVWRRWPRPKKVDFASRRAALRLLALGAAGVAGWWATQGISQARAALDLPRRFTGSRERGSFSGNSFPITNGDGEGSIQIDPSTWKLTLSGAVESPRVLTYEDLLSLPARETKATLDCTLGWYSTQVWRGVWLADLLARAGLRPEAYAVRLKAISGYAQFFTLAEAREILVATHVGGQPIEHWHGFPLRAVVPSRRGWFWVKWLTEIEVVGSGRDDSL